ncbi:hypothetical protein F4778DRAFT_266696 [Xylariomycetidae sp. FL2044]|nr:hypothetical protein F4778DRAFT_266696 [Xylariomycetidae sp. FL2044]
MHSLMLCLTFSTQKCRKNSLTDWDAMRLFSRGIILFFLFFFLSFFFFFQFFILVFFFFLLIRCLHEKVRHLVRKQCLRLGSPPPPNLSRELLLASNLMQQACTSGSRHLPRKIGRRRLQFDSQENSEAHRTMVDIDGPGWTTLRALPTCSYASS